MTKTEESCDDGASKQESVAPVAVFRTPPTIPVTRIPHVSATLGNSDGFNEKRPISELIEKDVLAQCALHGDYVTERLLFAGRSLTRVCPTCSAAEELRRAADAERERIEAAQRFADKAINGSGLPRRFRDCSIENFQLSSEADRRAADVSARFLAEWGDGSRGAGLVFFGNVGTGKTHLVSAIVRALALRGFSAGYTTALEVLQTLRATWQRNAPETEAQVLARLERLDLLVIDEIGRTFGSEAERVQFFEVFNRRYRQQRSTIIVSNLDLAGIEDALGEAVFDRFRQNATVVHFPGASKRALMRDAA